MPTDLGGQEEEKEQEQDTETDTHSQRPCSVFGGTCGILASTQPSQAHAHHPQLAAAALHPDERLADIHLPLLRLHLLPEPAVRVLLLSAPDPLRLVVSLVGPLLLRLQQQLVRAPAAGIAVAGPSRALAARSDPRGAVDVRGSDKQHGRGAGGDGAGRGETPAGDAHRVDRHRGRVAAESAGKTGVEAAVCGCLHTLVRRRMGIKEIYSSDV